MPELTFENLLKIALPFFILLGISNLASYYGSFKIPILEYLEFSEIITIFLSHIYIIFFLFIVVSYLFINEHKVISFTAIFAFILFLTITVANPSFAYNYSYGILVPVFVISLLSITFYRGFNIDKKITTLNEDQRKKLRSVTYIVFIGLSILLFSCIGTFNAYIVKKKHIFQHTVIEINGNKFESNDSCYYIGKSHNYIFLYDEKRGTPIIYPIEKVEKIIYQVREIENKTK